MKYWMAPHGLHVEMAAIKHIPAMAKLHTQLFFQGWSENDFASYLSKPHINPAYVACDNKNRLAGFMVLGLSGDECELLSISVRTKWRAKGVGNAILQAALDDLLTTPIAAMFLEVDQGNAAAIALYKGFGFIEVGKRKGYYLQKQGTRATALVMRVNLD